MPQDRQHNLFGHEEAWEIDAAEDQLAAEVVLGRPLQTAYQYLVPDELREAVAVGQRVKVPFGKGNRPTVGYVVGLGSPPAGRALKPLAAILDEESLLTPTMLELTRWIAEEYLCGWGQVLETVVPAGVKKKAGTRMATFYRLRSPESSTVNPVSEGKRAERSEAGQEPSPDDLPPKQRAVIETLWAAQQPMRAEDLTRAAGCGTGVIQTLRKKGLIETVQLRVASRESRVASSEFASPLPTGEGAEQSEAGEGDSAGDLPLNADQQYALQTILSVLRAGRHQTLLLHGVTGSGKTEVYIQAIREVISYGRQAIVLVPEISLTPQTIRRFRSRFDSVAVLHSHLSDVERHRQWRQIAAGGVQVVVGARSAVFAPTPHLGMIVIDEEHETSFKQETTPRYHAREVARRRAELESIPLVLGSATPTLESWHRAEQKQDTLLSLPKRIGGLPMPPVVLVDTRYDRQIRGGEALGRVLTTAMQRSLADGGQVLLFLNLRGHSTALWCRACGESLRCPHCDITLTWHQGSRVPSPESRSLNAQPSTRDSGICLCHVCDFHRPPPRECPGCHQPGVLYLGTGTQRLEKEVRGKFPDHTILRMDSDSMRRPGSHAEALEAFRQGTVHILLGTQMIAKGLDFPNVTLVGVIDAETMLHQPDIRAAERTFCLLTQVAGRTGRGEAGGRVLVQTASPAEPAILKASEHDYGGFVQQELRCRREMGTPPYRRLARVILRGRQESAVRRTAEELAELLKSESRTPQAESDNRQSALDTPPLSVLGPAPAPITKLKDHYRYHLQIAAAEPRAIHQLWNRIADRLPKTGEVEYVIDVDPITMR